jgi:hypothetical protein
LQPVSRILLFFGQRLVYLLEVLRAVEGADPEVSFLLELLS